MQPNKSYKINIVYTVYVNILYTQKDYLNMANKKVLKKMNIRLKYIYVCRTLLLSREREPMNLEPAADEFGRFSPTRSVASATCPHITA